MKSFKTENGITVNRVSRWIKVEHVYNVTPRHCLYHYATDEYGYQEGEEKFNPKSGMILDCFKFKGKKYAVEQFLLLDRPMVLKGKREKVVLSGYDCEDYGNSLLVEFDEYCEHVRCYYEERKKGALLL